ncbi:hypothetical protein GCM10023115_05410 [Pontixanthobacter gangjinensis]
MARYGLGQKDLNLRAAIALAGLTKRPDVDVAILLRSNQPMEPYLREMLAIALEGKSSGIDLKISNRKGNQAYRSFRLRLDRIEQGNAVLRLIESGEKYDDAVEAIAAENSINAKSVEAAVTYRKKVLSWMKRVQGEKDSLRNLDDNIFNLVFAYADVSNRDRDGLIKLPSASLLPILMEIIDRNTQVNDFP